MNYHYNKLKVAASVIILLLALSALILFFLPKSYYFIIIPGCLGAIFALFFDRQKIK